MTLPTSPSIESDPRKDVGNRGELYTYHFEQLHAEDSSMIRWVAKDNEGLGYDVEDISVYPHRRIEVKASTSSEIRFFLSANEWEMAHYYGEHYEIHFWGGIDLNRVLAEEYSRLRAIGYPLIYQDVAKHLEEDLLNAIPTQYVVKPLTLGSEP